MTEEEAERPLFIVYASCLCCRALGRRQVG